jgi:hypothetical protein
VDHGVTRQLVRHKSSSIGFSAFTTLLVAAMPKCPICWMALMSAVGAGSIISSRWLQPVAIALLFVSMVTLFVLSRLKHSYGPFVLGLAAAVLIYLFKFKLNYDLGVYLSGAVLIGASIWNILPKQRLINIQTNQPTN